MYSYRCRRYAQHLIGCDQISVCKNLLNNLLSAEVKALSSFRDFRGIYVGMVACLFVSDKNYKVLIFKALTFGDRDVISNFADIYKIMQTT